MPNSETEISGQAKDFTLDPTKMTLSSVMREKVVTIDMDASLGEALELCNGKRIRHLPVVDRDGTLVGMLTDRDIRFHLSPRLGTLSENESDRSTLHRRVHLVMARRLITGTPEMSLARASRRILQYRVGCLPVVNAEGIVVGIVSASDFLLLMAASADPEELAPHL